MFSFQTRIRVRAKNFGNSLVDFAQHNFRYTSQKTEKNRKHRESESSQRLSRLKRRRRRMADADAVLSQLNVSAPDSLMKFDPAIPLSVDEKKNISSVIRNNSGSKAPASHLDDVLYSILPPRVFLNQDKEASSDRKKYIQYVSKSPSSRPQVMELEKDLNKVLVERQARPTGVCPVREDIFSQVFDEMIRHITINCPERGLLLMRVQLFLLSCLSRTNARDALALAEKNIFCSFLSLSPSISHTGSR